MEQANRFRLWRSRQRSAGGGLAGRLLPILEGQRQTVMSFFGQMCRRSGVRHPGDLYLCAWLPHAGHETIAVEASLFRKPDVG